MANNSKNIKNIIFDLGGVILDIDPGKTRQAFRELGFSDLEALFAELKDIIFRFETGKVTKDTFYNVLKEHNQNQFTFAEMENAWNSMILDIPRERVDILKSLKGKYRTFLLSNTNEIHLEKYGNIATKKFNLNIRELFEKAYFSHEVGMRKPGSEIYYHVLKNHDLHPEETLFIDDLEENIHGAESVGMQTRLLKPPDDLLTLEDEYKWRE
jgi:putative hydrolase of the HAD superfamily